MRHRAGNVGGGGGGGNDYMYGSSASGSLGYAGGLGGYDAGRGSGPFKDKPKRKGSFVIPTFVQSPWTGFVAALLFAALALHYRSQSSGIMSALQVGTVKQGRELVEKLRNERQEADRGMQRAKSAEKQALVRIQALEKQQRVLEQERDNFRKLAAAGPGSGSAAATGGIAAAVGSIVAPEAAKKREADLVTFLHRLQNFTQQASKDAVLATYGPGPHQVRFRLELPGSDSSSATELAFTVETAPVDLMPHATHVFLEQVSAGLWNTAWFYVNGPHVLQCGPQAQDEDVNDDHLDDRELALKPFAERGLGSLFYPEYSPLFPHEKWTLGMTGRPGGPDWYINKQNNTVGHAPGGQSQFPLADMYGDPCFAKVIDGFDALEKVFTQPTIQSGDYRFFFEHPIHIVKAEIVSPMVPQLKPWQVQQQQQTQPDGAQQQDPPKQQELPQQQAVDTQGQQLPQQQQQQQELQQQQPLQQQQQQTQSEQVQQQVPQDSQQQQQQQGQQQGAASSESGKPVEFVHEPGGAAAGPGDGATASGGGKRMRQLMMAKLPPLNVEP